MYFYIKLYLENDSLNNDRIDYNSLNNDNISKYEIIFLVKNMV